MIRKSIEKKAKNHLQIESEISFLDHNNNIQILRGSLNHLSHHLDTLSSHLSDHLINQKISTQILTTQKSIYSHTCTKITFLNGQ